MKPRAIIKDLLIIVVGYWIIKAWYFGDNISPKIGLGTIAIMLIALKFTWERFGLRSS